MIFNQPGDYRNSDIISDGVTIAVEGVTLTNASEGVILGGGVTFTEGGSTFINELGAEVGERNSFAHYPNVLVQGSSGSDTMINAGYVWGQVRLGDGEDIFIDRNGAVQGTGWEIYLEGGDDILRIEAGGARDGSTFANGGDGYDTVVVASPGNDPRQAAVFGFERLVLESGGNIAGYSGFETVVLASTQPFTFYNFINCRNPDADLFLSIGQWVQMVGSEFRSITGSDGSDAVALVSSSYPQTRVLGDVRLGGGNDSFTINAAYGGINPVVGGSIDGGEGVDSFNLIVGNGADGGGTISLDLAQVVGFEQLFVNAQYNFLNSSVTLSNLAGFQTILAGEMTNLMLSSAGLPDAELRGAAGGSVTLGGDVVIGSYSAFRFDPVPGLPEDTTEDLSSSVTFVNNGTVTGSIRFAGGFDLYDGRQGSVGGIVDGGAGDDRLLGGVGADHLVGGAGNDTLIDAAGDDMLVGGGGDDVLDGGAGDDVLVGGQGNDRLNGGEGNDTVDYSQETGPGGVYVNLNPGTVIFENGDTIGPFQARDTFGTIDTLSSIETVITGSGADTVLGSSQAERIETGAGNDFLNGGGGADTLVGGSGDDVYFVSQAPSTTIIELADGGTDEIRTPDASFTLAGIANVENLRGWSSFGQVLTGNELGNRITGREGADILYGADGDDTLIGDAGNDIIDGGSGNDVLAGGEGSDRVSYAGATAGVTVNLGIAGPQDTLGAGTDTLSGFEILIGSDHGDRLTAGAGNNIIAGGGGNDTLLSSADGDRLFGEAGDDTFIANGNDEIDGGEGFDTVDYSAASAGIGSNGLVRLSNVERIIGSNFDDHLWWAAEMSGGAGNDVYSVNSSSQVVEAAGQGIDRVESWGTDYTLPENVENLSLHFDPYAGATVGPEGERNGTGNSLDNIITGTGGANRLSGLAGADTLTGGDGIDILTGGTGNDTFRDTAAGLNGDTVTDFSAGDRIVITNANLAGFTVSLSGNTLTFTGGSLTLGSVPAGQIVAQAAAGGGVQLSIAAAPSNDFNGDGRSDLAWRNADGTFTTWLGQPNGSFASNPGTGANPLDTSWRIVGTGDFNGDGGDDILWRHDSGVIGEWLGHSSGPFTNNGGAAANAVDNSWSVDGIADYNGDGRDDILWRHTSGEVGQWLGMPSGGFANNGGAAANAVDPSWTVVANGDFNGDGRADVLWRHSSGVFAEWQGSASGALVNAGGVMGGATGSIVGSGDFNADGRDDVLARAADGTITVWLGQSTGQFTSFTPTRQINDLNWKIASIGDYNGDGSDDLLWRHASGETGEWLASGSGDFAYNGALPTMDTSWTIQSPDILLV